MRGGLLFYLEFTKKIIPEKQRGRGSTLSGQAPDRNGKSILMASFTFSQKGFAYDFEFLHAFLRDAIKNDFPFLSGTYLEGVP